MSFIRDLIVGKELIPARGEYKYAMIRGQFAFIIIGVAVFYIILDSINNVFVFIPWYLVMAGVGIFTLYLNRKRHYGAATIIQLVLINLLVFIFADADHPQGGVFFFFMTCSVVGLILLSSYNRTLSFFFALLPIVLAYGAFLTDLNIIPPPRYEPHMVRINFLANLTIGIFSNVVVIYFLIKRNRESEKSLIKLSSELKVSEERFALALRGTRAGIYEWHLKTKFIYVSSYWKELLGYTESELNHLNEDAFIPLVHPDDRARTRTLINERMAANKPYQNEFRLVTKNGEYRWFQDSGVFKTDDTGSIYMVVGSLIDIEERKRAEVELEQKNRQLAKTNEELDRFVYSASHDMRAPLSSMLGLIHLSEKTDKPEEVGLFLQMMKDRIKTMEGFIKEVTDYSRNTRLDLTPYSILLHTLVKEVVQTLAYPIVNKKVRIEIGIDPTLQLTTDPNRLKVVINNLLSNAYKYHNFDQADPFILINAILKNETVMLTVKDNGTGIAPEHHNRIFEMFYRASEDSEGSGLGLYIVKETLDKLSGTISVQSKPGVGTEFTITLPVFG